MINFLVLIARNRLALFGGLFLSLIILLCLITPLLPLYEPNVIDTPNRFKLPLEVSNLLGTDHLGRDLLSRLLWGTRLSLLVGFSAALIAAIIGSILGAIAGYYGNKTDNIIMRFVDVLMAFPYILLALAIVAALGPGLFNAMIAVALVNIPFFARNIRGVTVTIANQEYIDAARLSGASNFKILIFEVLPNILPVIIVAISTTVGWMILETAGLSFLGLGSQPPQADLGSMLGEARSALITKPHTSFIPGIMIFLIVMSINLFGDGIRDALDPRLNKGQLSKIQPTTKKKKYFTSFVDKEESILSVQNLSTQFTLNNSEYYASNNISFDLKKGECLGIIGESGSGKSVTALSLTSLVASPPGEITGGHVVYKKNDVIDLSYNELRKIRGNKISYIFQDPLSTLHPLIKIGDQIIEALETHHGKDSSHFDKVKKLLIDVQIPNPEIVINSYPHEISGGMRQRVSIAIALSNDPEILIADEPTTALDVTVQAQILKILNNLRQERSLSIIFISHDFGVISQICNRIIVMYAGEIIEQGDASELLKNPKHPYTASLIKCVPQLGDSKSNLHSIKGSPPLLDNLPNGCKFADRCNLKKEECNKNNIRLKSLDRRMVRCLYPITNQ